MLSGLMQSNERVRSGVARQLQIGSTDLRALYLIDAHYARTPKDLAEQLDITTGSVTPLLDRLEAAGFIERRPNPTDRRSMVLQVTPAGGHARKWGTEHYERAVQQVVDQLPSITLQDLHQILSTLTAALDDVDPSAGQLHR